MRIFFILIIIITPFSIYAEQDYNVENNIYKNLRCLVCQGQSISESNSDFAQTIKSVVKDQLKMGKSENEIYDFLSEKYGDWILYKPKLNKINFLLWIIPYVALIFGVILIYLAVYKKRH